MGSKFYREISKSMKEKEVETVYNKGLALYFSNAKINHPYNCDGYMENDVFYDNKKRILRLLIEYKLDEKLDSKTHQAKVLVQALYYIKNFELNGDILPNVTLIGDKNECFVLHTNDINNYLDEDIDWSIAPSEAPNKNPNLVFKIAKDEKINPFVFKIDDNFSFKEVADKIKYLALNIQRLVRMTDQNISKIYDYFITKVIKEIKKYNANDLVYMFIDLMICPKNNYKHPIKKNTLVLSNGNEININGNNYDAFFNHFERKYSPSEKERFTAISDRLIEDTTRRFKGEFYTPTSWVDEAHKVISSVYGDDWKEKYVVWDCAWGTGNLTRDYLFRELYCSTINEGDLKIASRYNINSVKFKYDFLNDDIDLLQGATLLESEYKIPKSLLYALKSDRKIIFFLNPPYGTSGSGGAKGSSKKGMAESEMNKLMKKNKVGRCSEQLFAQFLYRIFMFKKLYNLTNINICIYATPIYMSGESFKKFRKVFLKEFKYESGILFQASHFSDVKNRWGISFSCWSSGESINKTEFIHELKDIDNTGIVSLGKKNIYNLDEEIKCSDWIRKEIKDKSTVDMPQFITAISIKQSGNGKALKGSLGYCVNSANAIYENDTYVFITSATSCKGHGVSITKDNIMNIVSNFTARKLITGKHSTWINHKDEYMKPYVNKEGYKEWNYDALVYSIFNTASNQSSVRKIQYKDKKWNVFNEFFFMSKNEILKLADLNNNDQVYEDVKNFGEERYVYKLLENTQLSTESQVVLDKARDLVYKSFKYREVFNEDNPEYFINSWDAGWYQIKGLLNEYMKEELIEFNNLYKELENKMRPNVYEFGFLK
ncbi:conserved hypothetical protein [Clostridium botulinum B str. Eklund 17B (NRP)]|uniref:Uncharacterized protein n=1 Tax=Clostridium botulinum (strain Eklund 17B / Type B) TaxID=935198 RepID=B2TLI2_CLOBB|nr:conserved hypothetical protein [Clostridium botulinum B str. Eklund 17B (NRP)]MBY6976972.1 hypothetical protein [Clostridium botulinum]MBY6999129.1 hypothetical protein [Clostridium botulinum]NFD69843.1 hypothetical protein [Clostridium botulinum]NFF50874.1 hypothetical protein [Clostridium botulinum]